MIKLCKIIQNLIHYRYWFLYICWQFALLQSKGTATCNCSWIHLQAIFKWDDVGNPIGNIRLKLFGSCWINCSSCSVALIKWHTISSYICTYIYFPYVSYFYVWQLVLGKLSYIVKYQGLDTMTPIMSSFVQQMCGNL